MKMSSLKYMNLAIFMIFAFLTTMAYTGSTHAGDYGMKTNLSSMSELMAKFSKQLSSGKVDPKAQEKMGEILSRMSQVLQEMTGTGGNTMHVEHRGKIETMKKEWNPFDTSDKM